MKKILIIFSIGIAFSFAAFAFVLHWEKSKRQQEFSIRALAHTAAIRTGFETIAKQQEDIRFLIEFNFNDKSNHKREPADFIQMLSPIITHEPSMRSIHWAVLDEDNYIQFIFGSSDGDTAKLHNVIPPLKTISAHMMDNNNTLALISPITNTVNTISNDEILQGKVEAQLISEWKISTLVEQSLKFVPVSAMDIRLSIVSNDENKEFYFYPSRSRTEADEDKHTDVKSTNIFTFKGLTIQAEFEAAPQFLRDFPIVLAWQTLFTWMLATFILTWFLHRREKRRIKLRRIVDNLQDVYYQMDMHGKIIFVSKSINTLGYTQETMVGSYASDYFDDPEAFKTLLDNLSKSGTKKLHDYHVQINHKNGEALWISLNAKYIYNTKNAAIGIEGTLHDFTERKEQQDELKQADKLENLGIMAAGIAHNFNNILAVIIGNTSLAKLHANDNESLENHLNEIEKESEKATLICKQILVYTELNHHETKSLNISQAIHSLSSMIQASFSKLADIQFNLQTNVPNISYADPDLIRQMVIDLIHNAAESYGENYGVVQVRTGLQVLEKDKIRHCIGVKNHQAGEYLFLTISDQGCGIPKDVQSKIFEPFFSTKFVGRGLGLSAVRGTILSYSGLILLESQENEGTTITIFLPIDNTDT